MLSLCPWRTKAAFIDSYCYPYVSSWEGKDVYRLSRCSSGTQPSTCLSCYWEVRKLKQQRVVNPERSLSFTVTKKKEIISYCILYNTNVLSCSFTTILCLIFRVFQFPRGLFGISLWNKGAFFNRKKLRRCVFQFLQTILPACRGHGSSASELGILLKILRSRLWHRELPKLLDSWTPRSGQDLMECCLTIHFKAWLVGLKWCKLLFGWVVGIPTRVKGRHHQTM